MISEKDKISLLESIFGNVKVSASGNDVAVVCPSCLSSGKIDKDSSKKKLSISLETGRYHCWICEAKGSANFWKLTGCSDAQISKIRSFWKTSSQDTKIETPKEKKVELPQDFRFLFQKDRGVANLHLRYLRDRGVSDEDIIRWKIGYSLLPEWKNRLIFPSFDSSLELNYFLTRSIDPTSWIKYKNCDLDKKSIIFNEHLIDWKKTLKLVEGVFDAIKAGKNAVPMLGSWMSEDFRLFEKIIQNETPVILSLDKDARDKELKLANKLTSWGIDVSLTEPDDRDLGSLSYHEAQLRLSDCESFEKLSMRRFII